MSPIKKIKDQLYICKEWIKKLWIYPQQRVQPGAHFDYDAYWRERREGHMGGLGRWQAKRAALAARVIKSAGGKSTNDIGSGAGEVLKYVREHTDLARAIAYDSSPYALDMAKQLGLDTKLFDINTPGEFAAIEQADFTMLFEILEHVPGPE